jgi:aminoglycoside phosphotransferase (APT) family kinase protein
VYEARIYRHVLHARQISAPAFYGTYTDPSTGCIWLVIEYLANSHCAAKHPGAVFEAARWIGRFHAMNEARLSVRPMAWLKRYDADYYRGWARRTLQFGGRLRHRRMWLPRLCERFERVLPLLLASPPTIIHGEFYPTNILAQDGLIYPVDWESAAIGPGEIDLTALTEEWRSGAVRRCEAEYASARWAGRSPADFERTLDAARLYWCFRWLGDDPETTSEAGSRAYFQIARSLGEKLGLL